MRPVLAVSVGCPGGIGPEIALRAASQRAADAKLLLVGDMELLRRRAVVTGVRSPLVQLRNAAEAETVAEDAIAVLTPTKPLPEAALAAGHHTPIGGAAQLAWIDTACDVVASGEARALVTGPVSKAAIASSGAPGSDTFLGHTEHLGARLGGAETVMCFWAEKLTISLATTHLPLGKVAQLLTPEDVARATYWTTRLMDDLGADPSLAIAVLSLNPHAGESGLLGHEERTILDPGIALARERLSREGRTRSVVGPIPAESAIRRTVRDHAYAACVAMYHDQATIPSKLVAFGDAVNVTLGMPIIRTSVDHGTAYDLAGTGKADASGMLSAVDLAIRLANVRP